MGKLLKDAGHKVTLTMDGREGAAAALKHHRAGKSFHIIFMDMDMPRMNGHAATRKLRERGYTGIIVALTSLNMPADRRKCLEVGCNDYAAKPISKPKLMAIIDFYERQQKTSEPDQPEANPN